MKFIKVKSHHRIDGVMSEILLNLDHVEYVELLKDESIMRESEEGRFCLRFVDARGICFAELFDTEEERNRRYSQVEFLLGIVVIK